jgi:hypothetical protein
MNTSKDLSREEKKEGCKEIIRIVFIFLTPSGAGDIVSPEVTNNGTISIGS